MYDNSSSLCLANRYILVPFHKFRQESVMQYWNDLKACGRLKRRIPQVLNPNFQSVMKMYEDKNNLCFMMYDPVQNRLCAETMLNGFRGLCAEVHFSMHPDYSGEESVYIAKSGVEQLFQTMKDIKTGEYLTTLYGLTPTSNRLAIKFIKKVGFKILDKLENMFYIESSSTYVNAAVSKLMVLNLYDR